MLKYFLFYLTYTDTPKSDIIRKANRRHEDVSCGIAF